MNLGASVPTRYRRFLFFRRGRALDVFFLLGLELWGPKTSSAWEMWSIVSICDRIVASIL